MATKTREVWQTSHEVHNELKKVCDKGEECREDVWNKAGNLMKQEYIKLLERTCSVIVDSWTKTKKSIQSTYTEVYHCEPMCYCEDIQYTYTDHWRLRGELEKQTRDLQAKIWAHLEWNETTLETCPDYAQKEMAIVFYDELSELWESKTVERLNEVYNAGQDVLTVEQHEIGWHVVDPLLQDEFQAQV